MGGIESDGGVGLYIAYAAIVAFVVLLVAILGRTVGMYTLLLLSPLARLMQVIPGLRPLLDRLSSPTSSPDAANPPARPEEGGRSVARPHALP